MTTETTEVAQPTETVETVTKTTDVVSQEPGEKTEANPAVEAQETDAEKTQKRMQRAIDRQAAKKYEARAEADALRREIEQLRQRVQPSGGEGEQTEQIDVEAVVNQRAQEIISVREENNRAAEIVKAGQKLEGFADAVVVLRDDERLMFDKQGRPTDFMRAIQDSDAPEKLILYLGQNPDEAAEFKGLNPTQIGRRIERLENKLKDEAKVKISTAPKPLTPVTGSAVKGEPDPDRDGAAWIRSRNEKTTKSSYF
jgi:hypothetical protein